MNLARHSVGAKQNTDVGSKLDHMPIIITYPLELIYGAGSEPLVKLGSLLAIGTKFARDKAFHWAMVTAEDLGERIQALAIAMAELVGVEEVDRGAEP